MKVGDLVKSNWNSNRMGVVVEVANPVNGKMKMLRVYWFGNTMFKKEWFGSWKLEAVKKL
tara:strand:+ start:120 stop:299 length:180 start_codon:yes stop_codon:yes gene_type:complete